MERTHGATVPSVRPMTRAERLASWGAYCLTCGAGAPGYPKFCECPTTPIRGLAAGGAR